MNLTTRVLADEYVANKEAMDKLKARNGEIAKEMEKAATFSDGKNTAHIDLGDVNVKVERKFNEKFDQAALNAARSAIGDDKFLGLFRWEWKPNSTALKAFLAEGDQEKADLLRKARTVTPGAPAIEIKAKKEA